MFRTIVRRLTLLLGFLALLSIGAAIPLKTPLLSALNPDGLAISVAAAGTGCSTIYAVTNTSTSAASYVHDFKNSSGTVAYSFNDSLAAGAAKAYDTRTLSGLSDGFTGSLTVSSDQTLSAVVSDVAGCDSLKYAASSTPTAANIEAGQTVNVKLTLTNNSTVFPWPASGPNPVHVGYHLYQGSTVVGSWDSGQRATLPADVPVGSSVTVDVPVKAPMTAGNYTIWFDLVHEGVGWFGSFNAGPFGANLTVVTPFASLNWISSNMPATVAPNQDITVQISVKNTSNSFTWLKGGATPVHVGSHWVQDGKMLVWDGQRGPLPQDVAPGQTVTSDVPVHTPSTPGTYTIWFDLVQETVTWFGAYNAPSLGAIVTVASPYTSIKWSNATVPSPLGPGQTVNVPITVQNTSSTFTWNAGGNNPIHIGYHTYKDSQVLVWDGERGPLPNDVKPGDSVTVNVPVTAPTSPGDYTIWFDLVQEGVTWFGAYNAPSLGATITVSSPYTQMKWIGATMPETLTAGKTINVPVTVQNVSSNFTWNAGGSTPIHIGSHLYQNGQVVVWDGQRGPFPHDIVPGETVTVSVPVIAPSTPGSYTIWFDLVQETVTWFGAYNAPSIGFNVTVQ